MQKEVENLVGKFNLQPHPEGGYFKETYRSATTIPHNALPPAFTGDRAFATAIYFLLDRGNFSAFHRIQSDECWHFYAGDRLLVHVIHADGRYEQLKLGNREGDESFQSAVPAGAWFASETTGDYSFVGCTVSPGFDFLDFELAKADSLSAMYPQHETLIRKLCRI